MAATPKWEAEDQTLNTPDTEAGGHPKAALSASGGAVGAPEDSLNLVISSLEDSKAEQIVNIDISGKSALGDYMVIASGRSHRHVGAIADHLARALKGAKMGPVRIEGLPNCDWVLIDIGDIIVHIFRPEVREFYNLEKMWTAEPYSERRMPA